MRPSWIEVDLDAVRHNVAAIAALVAPSTICAVVKADAYGHGDVPVAEAALDAGAAGLAVATPDEAIRLREAGIDAPVLLLSEPPADAAPALVEWRITPTVYAEPLAAALSESVGHAGPVDVHIKVDTGMHRVGAAPATLPDLARSVAGLPGLRVAAVWTHLAVADEDPVFTARQLEVFDTALASLRAMGVEVPLEHVANTAGALLHPETRRDMVRVGLGIYGLYPCEPARSVVDLRPALRLVSRVGHITRLDAGERPSYGRRRPMPADGIVATVPVGYADGVPRRLSATGGSVLVGGRRCPLAGTVTMDQIVVDVGGGPVAIGDEVVLLGSQGNGEISADDWADRLDTITYEIVTRLGPRLPRRYVATGGEADTRG